MANTKITITEGVGQIDMHKLNIAELIKNTEYSKLAYCNRVEVGTTGEGKPFFKFSFLDKGGHAITGRLFNVEDVENKGVTANKLANRVVKIKFDLSTFSGIESLRLISIDPVPNSVLSREEFIGDIPDVDKFLLNIQEVSNQVCESYKMLNSLITKYNLLSGAEMVSMPGLWSDRKGGAVKFSSKFLNMIKATFDEGVLTKALAIALLSEIFMYWKYACYYEEDILSLGDNINVIMRKSDKYLDAVIDAANKNNDKDTLDVCKETKHLLKCYFGYTEPQTFLSKSLNSLRESLIQTLTLENIEDGMISGTYKTIQNEDGSLTKIVKL